MHALRRVGVHRAHQVLVHHLGDEGDGGRQQLAERDQHVVQRAVGSVLVLVGLRLPEAAAAAPHVPVGEIVQERFHDHRGPVGVVVVQSGGDFADDLVETSQDPAIQ